MNKNMLKRRGWTGGQIRAFLGEPDSHSQNPMYRSGAPVCNYDDARVLAAEASPEFAESQSKLASRRHSAAQAVETKRRQIQDYLDNLEITVPKIDEDTLLRLACENYCSDEFVATPNSDRDFLDRITVNYLRHRLTCYEEALDDITGKVG